jgi:hypothetical protein
MRQSLGPVVATTELQESQSRRKVVVSLGRPRKLEDGHWVCSYRIRGLRTGRVRDANGYDAIQALIHAIESIRLALARSGRELTCVGCELGDTGFPRFVPTFFGSRFTKRLNGLIDRELDRFGRALEQRHRRRKSARSPRPRR